MKRKLTLSLIAAGCLLAGPAAAKLSSGDYFQEWYNQQLQTNKSKLQQELILQTSIFIFDISNWTEQITQTIDKELDVSELISIRSNEMSNYARMQKGRVQAAKDALHTQELDVFAAEQKEKLQVEMDEELAEYFEKEFLNRE